MQVARGGGTALSILFLGSLVLAGCAGGPEATAADDEAVAGPAEFDDQTGGVEGIVLDDEDLPVAGAQVALIEAAVETLSDASGKFALSNVPPGRYTLAVQKLGYQSDARSIEVVQGQPTTVQVALVKIVLHTPYQQVWGDTGYFECSSTLLGSTGPCGFLPFVGSTPVQDLWTENKRHWVYNVGPGTMSVFNEMTWNQGSFATGETLRITFSYENRTTSHWYCGATGTDPVVMQWERSFDDGQPDWEGAGECRTGGDQLPDGQPESIPMEGHELRSFVNTGPSSVNGNVGLALGQSFDIWFSVFYWEPAPEGWSALPDA
jgi:hypothetical protein